MTEKLKVATCSLAGCFGCHMSLLDIDEKLFDLLKVVEFDRSPITDNNSFEQWEAEGSRDLAQRANASFKKQLAEYEPPPMDVAVDEAILDYVNRRKGSFADSNI